MLQALRCKITKNTGNLQILFSLRGSLTARYRHIVFACRGVGVIADLPIFGMFRRFNDLHKKIGVFAVFRSVFLRRKGGDDEPMRLPFAT